MPGETPAIMQGPNQGDVHLLKMLHQGFDMQVIPVDVVEMDDVGSILVDDTTEIKRRLLSGRTVMVKDPGHRHIGQNVFQHSDLIGIVSMFCVVAPESDHGFMTVRKQFRMDVGGDPPCRADPAHHVDLKDAHYLPHTTRLT